MRTGRCAGHWEQLLAAVSDLPGKFWREPILNLSFNVCFLEVLRMEPRALCMQAIP